METRKQLAKALRCMQQGSAEQARTMLEALAAAAPEDAAVQNAVGAARYEAGELDGARAALERCVALEPRHPLAHATLGELALRRRDPRAAARHFEVALADTTPALAGIQRWVRMLCRAATSGSASTPR